VSKIDELRKVRYEHRKVAYTIGDLNAKLELEPNRSDLKAMRAKFLKELQRLDLRRVELLSEIKAAPYALVDVVAVLDSLANIQAQIAHGGAEEGQLAISAFIRNLTQDKDRLTELEAGASIAVEEPSKSAYTEAEKWQHRAAIRQGIISKLEKKLENRDARVEALEKTLAAIHDAFAVKN
jgi:hypothetical protein